MLRSVVQHCPRWRRCTTPPMGRSGSAGQAAHGCQGLTLAPGWVCCATLVYRPIQCKRRYGTGSVWVMWFACGRSYFLPGWSEKFCFVFVFVFLVWGFVTFVRTVRPTTRPSSHPTLRMACKHWPVMLWAMCPPFSLQWVVVVSLEVEKSSSPHNSHPTVSGVWGPAQRAPHAKRESDWHDPSLHVCIIGVGVSSVRAPDRSPPPPLSPGYTIGDWAPCSHPAALPLQWHVQIIPAGTCVGAGCTAQSPAVDGKCVRTSL